MVSYWSASDQLEISQWLVSGQLVVSQWSVSGQLVVSNVALQWLVPTLYLPKIAEGNGH